MKPSARTIGELARLANVSTATVSRVLNHDPRVAEKTRQRIENLIRETGYIPDPFSQGMAHLRWGGAREGVETIGMLAGGVELNNERFLEEALTRLGYRMDRFYMGDYPKGDRLLAVLRARGISALLIGTLASRPVELHLPPNEFVAVNVGAGHPGLPGYHTVCTNSFGALVLAYNHAVAASYKRIGVTYIRPAESPMEQEILAAFHFLQHERIEKDVELLACETDFKGKRVADWVTDVKPDVLLGRNDGFYWWSTSRGCRIPQDFAFASIQTSLVSEPGLIAGCSAVNSVVAEESVRLLHHLIQRRERGEIPLPLTYRIDPTWITGSSLPET